MKTDLYTIHEHYYRQYRAYRREMQGDTLTRPLSFQEWLLKTLWFVEISEIDARSYTVQLLADRENKAS